MTEPEVDKLATQGKFLVAAIFEPLLLRGALWHPREGFSLQSRQQSLLPLLTALSSARRPDDPLTHTHT